jgi:hypothetical protein
VVDELLDYLHLQAVNLTVFRCSCTPLSSCLPLRLLYYPPARTPSTCRQTSESDTTSSRVFSSSKLVSEIQLIPIPLIRGLPTCYLGV